MRVDLAQILEAAHRGDQSAWEALFRECYPKVRRVVRRKLNRSMRSLYDSTDFASDVMKSLAANVGHLDFPSIDSLMAFLAQVAEQKVIDEYRRRHTLKRDMTRERPLCPSGAGCRPGPALLRRSDRQPGGPGQRGPRALLSARNETERTIIELKQQGYSNADIAERPAGTSARSSVSSRTSWIRWTNAGG